MEAAPSQELGCSSCSLKGLFDCVMDLDMIMISRMRCVPLTYFIELQCLNCGLELKRTEHDIVGPISVDIQESET